jgi:alkane 1-monooxygenase
MRLAPFTLAYVYAAAVLAGAALRGPWVLLPALLTFVVLPALDALCGVSLWNPAPDEERSLAADPRYRWITWAWLPVGAAATFYALAASLGPGWSWPERIGLAVGTGLMNGVAGIVYAHELVHQPGRFEQFLGEAMLTLVTYTHFRVEHVFGHHRLVATPHDPATSRYGESFYAFLVRSVGGQVVSAARLEAERLERLGAAPWGPRNRILAYAAVLVLLYAAIFALAGWPGAIFFAAQSVAAFVSLEVVNYLEHYGLVRREIAPGKYETVKPRHSWNSAHRVSNWLMINLARHSDHHAVASRRYQILRTFGPDEAPQLPAGYGSMYVLALVPPLWFAVMNPRVDAWRRAFEAA